MSSRRSTSPRKCSRCGRERPADDYVIRGRICSECRAQGRPSDSKNKPRYCLHCHELKAPDAFAWGDGSQSRREVPKYRRRHGVCLECEAAERAEHERHIAQWRSTWERDGVLVRRCSGCGEVKVLEKDFYIYRRSPRVERAYYCKPCTIERVNEAKRRAKADPQRRKEILARNAQRNRQWRKRNPQKAREAQKRYRKKVVSDPQKHARFLEAVRIAHRLRRERQGVELEKLRKPTATMPRRLRLPDLPASPLVEAVQDALAGVQPDSLEAHLRACGIEPRAYFAWRTGERRSVSAINADAAVTGLDLDWWAVWPPEIYPQAVKVFGEAA